MIEKETIAALRKRVAELEAKLRVAGRDVDDRFRGAVDPIGEQVERKFGMKDDAMKTTMRVVAWGVPLIIVVAIVWWAVA